MRSMRNAKLKPLAKSAAVAETALLGITARASGASGEGTVHARPSGYASSSRATSRSRSTHTPLMLPLYTSCQ